MFEKDIKIMKKIDENTKSQKNKLFKRSEKYIMCKYDVKYIKK